MFFFFNVSPFKHGRHFGHLIMLDSIGVSGLSLCPGARRFPDECSLTAAVVGS